MTQARRRPRPNGRHKGFSSLLASFYASLFAALAVAYTALSGANTEIAANTRAEHLAYAAAETGVSVLRYHIARLTFSSESEPEAVFEALGDHLAAAFNGTLNVMGQSVSATAVKISVPSIAIPASRGASFSAEVTRPGNTYRLRVVGRCGPLARTVQVEFAVQTGPPNNVIMSNGIVSRGSIVINGSSILRSNRLGGASVMSLDPNNSRPVRINGSTRIDGDIYMLRDGVDADDVINGSASFLTEDGTYDTDADPHVHSGIDEPPWPKLDVSGFRDLIESLPHTTITSSSPPGSTFGNVYIAPNANPKFNGGTTFRGLVYVAHPNNVTFNGSTSITGLIICEPPPVPPSVLDKPACKMVFNGSVLSSGAENLPQTPEYDGLHGKIGSFVIAPDYELTFNGSMGTVNGSIYASGLTMNGSTAGTVRGSIIVDRRRTLTKNGSIDVTFEVDESYQLPAGLKFGTIDSLKMATSTYQEVQ